MPEIVPCPSPPLTHLSQYPVVRRISTDNYILHINTITIGMLMHVHTLCHGANNESELNITPA